jgi:hypothetical protein
MLKTPILFLIFNRPDTTQQVFDSIREQQPARLYVAADAPRRNRVGETVLCEQARAIINQVDWDCEIKTLFREENLGCKLAVSSAITWFFEQEESGIILEDDCLPDASFFPYCENLLERYKNDERIGHISGNCFLPKFFTKEPSYDFSSIPHIWGWATWRRVWKNYDVNFSYWEETKSDRKAREKLFDSFWEKVYFSTFISDSIQNKNGINAWSVQYLLMLKKQDQLSIYPFVNLVSNIGLNVVNATHTQKRTRKLYCSSSSMPFPLKHPSSILRNKILDKATIRKLFFSWKRLVRYICGDY